MQAQTFFLRPQSVLQHLHLHRLVRLEVRGGGGQAGADAETEAGERVVVGEDHDGLHHVAKIINIYWGILLTIGGVIINKDHDGLHSDDVV